MSSDDTEDEVPAWVAILLEKAGYVLMTFVGPISAFALFGAFGAAGIVVLDTGLPDGALARDLGLVTILGLSVYLAQVVANNDDMGDDDDTDDEIGTITILAFMAVFVSWIVFLGGSVGYLVAGAGQPYVAVVAAFGYGVAELELIERDYVTPAALLAAIPFAFLYGVGAIAESTYDSLEPQRSVPRTIHRLRHKRPGRPRSN